MSPREAVIRQEIRFNGDVQGVGFRYMARATARDFQVAGYVKNFPNGQVLMVVEGTPREVGRFRASLEHRMAGYISSVDVHDGPPTGEFDGFVVRF